MLRRLSDDHTRLLGELYPLGVHALSQPASVLGGYVDLLAAGVIAPGDRLTLERIQDANAKIASILGVLRRAQGSIESAREALVLLRGNGTVTPPGDKPG